MNPLTIAQRHRVERAVRRLIAAEVARSWLGSQPAEEHEPIERELRAAREAYQRALREGT